MRRNTMLMLAGMCCLLLVSSSDWNVTVRHLSNVDSHAKSSIESASADTSSLLSDAAATAEYPTPVLTEEEYEQQIIAYQKEFMKAFHELGDLRANTFSAIGNVWMDKEDRYVQQIYDMMEGYRHLHPPTSYQEIQDKYLEAMDKFEEGLDLYRQGFDQRDNEMIEASRAPLKKGQDLWNYANSRLQMKTEIPIGDGSLTTKDLREMELLAGIDRDSVLLNVSEDGNELSGRWGQPSKDGSITPSIIFHEQYSYEDFGNGQYPDMSNVTFGRWEYDYLTGVVTIHVHAVYQDGRSKGLIYQDHLRYEVQRFKDNQLQLMNLDTLETFEYTKAVG